MGVCVCYRSSPPSGSSGVLHFTCRELDAVFKEAPSKSDNLLSLDQIYKELSKANSCALTWLFIKFQEEYV